MKHRFKTIRLVGWYNIPLNAYSKNPSRERLTMIRESKERRLLCRSSCTLIPILSVLRAAVDQEVIGSEDPWLVLTPML